MMNLVHKIPFDIPIREILLEKGLISKFSVLTEGYGIPHLVCDENTVVYLPQDVVKTVLPATQKADLSTAKKLSKADCDFFIALGSGTINDLTKYAAYLAQKPYMVFATAPSMNGYASGNASLIDGKYKKSFSANPPFAIYADLEILENAPRRLINAGIGDTVCQPVIERDLWFSNHIISSPTYDEYFALIRNEEYFDSVESLTRTLIYSGIAMLKAGSSAPASQSEHMIAHLMEMYFEKAPQSFHGEQIAVTTLTMLEIQNKILEDGIINFMPPMVSTNQLTQKFVPSLREYFFKQTENKYRDLPPKTFHHQLPQVDVSALRKKLQAINAPTTPVELGWDTETYTDLLPLVKYTRDRLTFLDLI